ncbi:hypothetical protein ACFO9E_32610 [Streptomyces maoxianensis]|uniref:Uncharacterized protein n=1 Tax=Streptomyces maoxianensis TaxID=1459942 RepID=A0ABV9GH28_9ACTN
MGHVLAVIVVAGESFIDLVPTPWTTWKGWHHVLHFASRAAGVTCSRTGRRAAVRGGTGRLTVDG